MSPKRFSAAAAALCAAALLVLPPALHAEVIEEIVARINDDIITRSELQQAEQEAVSEIYANRTGQELDRELAAAREGLLKDLITKKLLVQQAERIYDTTKMGDSFIRQFKDQNKIASNAELERLLKDEGMTLAELKKKLIEGNAPSTVIQYEVKDKISIPDVEVEAWYEEHKSELASPEKVSFREIVLLAEGRSPEETRSLAASLAERARGGEDFARLAKESSQVAEGVRGALLGPFTRGELAPELEKAAFALKSGEISPPIEVGPAFHVVRMEKHEEGAAPSLDASREKISTRLEKSRFERALDDYILGLWRESEIQVGESYIERIPVAFRKFINR